MGFGWAGDQGDLVLYPTADGPSLPPNSALAFYINRSSRLLLSNSLAFPTLPKQNGLDARFEQIFSTFLVSLWQAPAEGSVASEAGLSEGDWKRKGTLALSP